MVQFESRIYKLIHKRKRIIDFGRLMGLLGFDNNEEI